MKKLYFLTIALVLISFLNLDAQTLLANYPLISDGVDVTGNNTEISIKKAPFQNGGIYSNGVYYGNDTTGSHIQSPQIVDFNFDDFTTNVDFLIEEHPEFDKPIIMMGTSWRWMSAWMSGDKIALKVNNGSFYEVSDVVVNLNEWYSVTISYNKADGEARLHLDGVLILTIEVAELIHGDNSRVVNSDGGIGNTYKGYWRNLEVHNTSSVASVDDKIMENIVVKPFGKRVQVSVPFENNGISMQMFDLSGRNIGEYKLIQGTNSYAVPKTNSVVVFVFADQKGKRSVRKILLDN